MNGSMRSFSQLTAFNLRRGHETLYVVRELTQKRVWFAEPLISATADEVRRSTQQGQRGRVVGQTCGTMVVRPTRRIRDRDCSGLPDVPHRYCDNHFLRDVAKPGSWKPTATPRFRCGVQQGPAEN